MKIIRKVLIVLGSFALLFFSINRLFYFHAGAFEQAASTVVYPFIRVASGITEYSTKLVKRQDRYDELLHKYQQLQNNYDELLHEVVPLRETIRHHSLTKELTDFKKRYKLTNSILGKILVKDISEHEHSFLINKGSHDDVTKDTVAIYKLQIIGKVTDVYPWYSKVHLITDRRCKIAAFTNTTNAPGIVEGTNSINECKLSFVDQLQKINDNDLVFSSGQGLVFPEGFCLGKITQHSYNKNDLYHTISIAPIIDLKSINYCLLTDKSKLVLF